MSPRQAWYRKVRTYRSRRFYYIKVWASTRKCVSPPQGKWKKRLWFSGTFLVQYKSRSWNISSMWLILTIGELCNTSNEGEYKGSKLIFLFLKWNFIKVLNLFLFQQVKKQVATNFDRNSKDHFFPHVSCHSEFC